MTEQPLNPSVIPPQIGQTELERLIRSLDRRLSLLEGKITPGPPLFQSGNSVVATNGSGIATVTFPVAFPSTPIVVAMGGNNESITTVNPTAMPTATNFSFFAYNQAGAALTSTSVRVLWIAVLKPLL